MLDGLNALCMTPVEDTSMQSELRGSILGPGLPFTQEKSLEQSIRKDQGQIIFKTDISRSISSRYLSREYKLLVRIHLYEAVYIPM